MVRLRSFREISSSQQDKRNVNSLHHNRLQRRVSAVTHFLDKKKRNSSKRPLSKRCKTKLEENENAPIHKTPKKIEPEKTVAETIIKKNLETGKPASRDRVRKWMRRVLPKDSTPLPLDKTSTVFQTGRKMRKKTKNKGVPRGHSSPVTDRSKDVITEESSSNFGQTRTQEGSPGTMSLGKILDVIETDQDGTNDNQTTMHVRKSSRDSEHLFIDCDIDDDTVEVVKVDTPREDPIGARMLLSSLTPPQNRTSLTENSLTDNGQPTKNMCEDSQHSNMERSEIIRKLFPLGHPDDQRKAASKRAFLFRKNEVTETKYNRLSKISKMNEKKVTNRGLFQRSEVIRSLFPMGHPDDRKNRVEEVRSGCAVQDVLKASQNIMNDTSFTPCGAKLSPLGHSGDMDGEMAGINITDDSDDGSDSVEIKPSSKKSQSRESDKFIGIEISFDPTWDLLHPEDSDSTSTFTRSRLKKFHEIEDYTNSLLGKFLSDESSEESIDLLANVVFNFDIEESLPSLPESTSKNFFGDEASLSSFELGFHFDRERFPSEETSPEIEICFEVDESSSLQFPVEVDDSIAKEMMCGRMKAEQIEAKGTIIQCRESEDGEDDDDSDNSDSCGLMSLDDFADCVEFETDMYSSLASASSTKKSTAANKGSADLNRASMMTNYGDSKGSAENPPPLDPLLSPTSTLSSYHSTNDTSKIIYEGKYSVKSKFYDAIMGKSPNHLSTRDRMFNVNPFNSPMGICNTAS